MNITPEESRRLEAEKDHLRRVLDVAAWDIVSESVEDDGSVAMFVRSDEHDAVVALFVELNPSGLTSNRGERQRTAVTSVGAGLRSNPAYSISLSWCLDAHGQSMFGNHLMRQVERSARRAAALNDAMRRRT